MADTHTEQDHLLQRQEELGTWFQGILPSLNEKATEAELLPLSGDASFRRYFTSQPSQQTYVLVDAPPDREDSRPFVQVAQKFLGAGVNVPKVFDVNYASGFMCLSYLGETLLWEKLHELHSQNRFQEAGAIYEEAFRILLKIQGLHEGSDFLLPPYDGVLLLNELELFREWFCGGIMEMELGSADHMLLDHFFEMLIDSALAQPQVCVHRDYHSRNLIYREDGDHGVLDFQDAVIGPVTYDLVSLIRDCYISWPGSQVREWALKYAGMASEAGILADVDEEEFLFSFDLMGVQRHLKATGIFSRLYLRDGKSGYLGDIPRTLSYVKEVLGEYPEFYDLAHWFEQRLYPMLFNRLQAAKDSNRNSAA